jgi:hypothetical protein
MASTYSTNLKIELIGAGEQSGSWNLTTNTNLGTAIEEAIVGLGNPEFTNDDNLILTISNSNSSQIARSLYLNVTSTVSLSTTWNLIVPDIRKPYIVYNGTTGGQSIVIKTFAGTGVTIPNGKRVIVYVDGVDVISQLDHVTSLTLGSALPVASGGTGSTSTAYCSLTTNVTGTLPIANGGTGSASTTYCSLTANVTGTLPVANGGTGVTTSTGSGNNVLSTSPTLATPILGTPQSGTLTNCTGLPIANTTGTLAIARGGTGSTSTAYCSLTANVTGTLPVANGGTGVTASTGSGNNVLSANPTFTGTITAQTITASGVISSSSNITYSSDARLKKDVKRIRWALWKIFRLRGVMFTVVKTEERNSGLIAQNLQKVMPELVHVDYDDGMLTIAYANLVGLLIEGIKEAVVLFLALFILALVM